MANVKISGLAAGITPVAADLMEGEVAAGSSVKWTMAQLWASMGFTSDKRLVLPAGAAGTPALQIGNRLAYDDGVNSLVWNCSAVLERAAGNQTQSYVNADHPTASPQVILQRKQSGGAPASGQQLGQYKFLGYSGTGTVYNDGAAIVAVATQTFSASLGGTRLSFRTTPQGSISAADVFGISDAGQFTRGSSPSVVIDPDGGVTFPSFTAAQIAAVGNAINTTNKREGKTIRDSTNKRLMVADGALAASTWTVADGSASVTPV